MALNLTKVAFGAKGYEDLAAWFADRDEELVLTTRYLPKRHDEMAGGSLYWILHHMLVARSPIARFGEAAAGRTAIVLEPRLIRVVTQPRRAHQGWRYLDAADAPADLPDGAEAEAMPARLAGELAKLGLV